ncbi:hypothetical protein [Streptomyces sp. NPDC005408]|uniref:hypothetical protein n=1 Tax=Streptomyces sp. NPDC005408 TaxID=3155341 RepID=UPI0033AA88E7
MTDRMGQLLAACDRQEFETWQSKSGLWFFRRDHMTVTFSHTPETASDWFGLIQQLRDAGLTFPEED